jgi:hypothetical protein
MLTLWFAAGLVAHQAEAQAPTQDAAGYAYGAPPHIIEAERAKEKARKDAERKAVEAKRAEAKERERRARESEDRRKAVQAAAKAAAESYWAAQSLTQLTQEFRAIVMAEAVKAAVAKQKAFAAIVAAQAEELRRLEAEALAVAQAEYERRLLQEQDDLAVMLLLAA